LHWNSWQFFRACCRCGTRIPILFSGDTVGSEECPFDAYRLDVAGRRAGVVEECVEVFVTHVVPDEKVQHLNRAGLAWCEVYARDVLDNLTSRSVPVRRCSVNMCCSCREQVAAQVEADARKALQLDEPGEFRDTVHQLRARRIEALRDEKSPWACFAADLRASAVLLAREHRIECVEAIQHGAVGLLTFGKHKGRYVSSLVDEDRPYVLWLAGFDFGRNEGTRPAARRPGSGAHHIPAEIESCAKQCVQGTCFRCGEETGKSWKTWCKRCFRAIAQGMD
jgi:hypothetical protein